MIKERFYVGDVVDIVPHDAVEDDYGIDYAPWEEERAFGPRVIKAVSMNGSQVDHYSIDHRRYSLCWPPDAFVLHEEPITVEVGDLL